jgi:mannose-6-phosphate isomerase-like protein (cupin superfamily)
MTHAEKIIANWADHTSKSRPCTPLEMQQRVARWGSIPASTRAFVDTYLPGHERTLHSVIGLGVSDDPNFKPAIAAAENFHVDYIVAPPGCGAALHCHDTEEVFVAITGSWQLSWGDEGEHCITLNERDVVSVPPHVHRSFKNLGDRDHLLLSILGGKHPGRVKWAPRVAAAAQQRGVGFDDAGLATKLE